MRPSPSEDSLSRYDQIERQLAAAIDVELEKIGSAATQLHGVRWTSLESTSAAAAGVTMPADYRVSLTDASGKDAYPMASFTYLLIHADAKDKAKGEALANFLWWAIHAGQAYAAPLDYAPLPKPVVGMVEKTIRSLKVQGKPVTVGAAN